MENEIWKDVEEFDNYYQISNYGRLRSKKRKINSSVQSCGYRYNNPKIMSPQNNGKGYLQYYVSFNKKRVMKYAHRLVAKYFISNPENLPEVNHINGIKTDNRVENLEWVTIQENKNHAVKNGLMASGENSTSAKITQLQVDVLRRLFKINPKFNREKAKEKMGVSSAQISRIIHGTRWKHL